MILRNKYLIVIIFENYNLPMVTLRYTFLMLSFLFALAYSADVGLEGSLPLKISETLASLMIRNMKEKK